MAPMVKKKWLIIYDIRNPRRLQKIAKLMAGYATRVQKSVFELDNSIKNNRKMAGKKEKNIVSLIISLDFVTSWRRIVSELLACKVW